MKFLRLYSLDPYLNLAIEEYLLDTADDDVFMLWQNRPSVVVGKNQNILAEVDTAALSRLGISPVRRITGGGAVYHDAGNINYTFIARKEADGIDFAAFSEPIIKALASLGVELSLSGRNDLCLKDGRKVSGNAQCTRGGRVLHHGTLLFDAKLDVLSGILTPDEEKLKSKAIRSTSSRVANLKELLPDVGSAEELIGLIEEYIFATLAPERIDPPAGKEIDRLSARNASGEWLYPTSGISATATAKRRRRFDFGTVELELSFRGERIDKAAFSGDFFGSRPAEELAALMCSRTVAELEEALTDAEVGSYIMGMSVSDLLSLITY